MLAAACNERGVLPLPLLAGTMREMFSTGVAAAHTGIPLHRVLDNQGVIHAAFHGGRVIREDTVIPLVTVRQGLRVWGCPLGTLGHSALWHAAASPSGMPPHI